MTVTDMCELQEYRAYIAPGVHVVKTGDLIGRGEKGNADVQV